MIEERDFGTPASAIKGLVTLTIDGRSVYTPLFAGVVYATTAIVGAAAARSSAPLSERFGIVATLVGLAAVSAVIVTGMALWAHAAVLGLVVFRSAQSAAAHVLISAAIAPVTERQHRATVLSLNSLVGRLGYGALLLIISTDASDDVRGVLAALAITSWVLVAILFATAAWAVGLRRKPSPE